MSRSRSKSTSDVSDSSCVVCCRNVTIYAVGECDHPVCYECATRMRVLCRQNECPICRRELPKVFFVKEKKQCSSISNNVYPRHDRRYKIIFEDVEVEDIYCRLLEHRCKICKNEPTFANFNLLKDHIRRDHEKYYCDLCVEHLTIFSHERKCYTRSELARHRRIGDTDDTSHRGHPLCEFCDERFLENDELFRHLRREHFFCHFCDADGYHHYYNDYEYLREHFRVEHFLCEEDECQQEKFTTAFRSAIDMKAHKAIAHNKSLSKVQAKQARTLELEFSIKPRVPLPTSSAAHSGEATGGIGNTYADDSDHHRKFRRGGGGGPNRGGMYASRHVASDRFAANDVNSSDQHAVASGNDASEILIDMNSENFPKLGEVNVSAKLKELKTSNKSGNHSVDTLARKLAKLNRFTVGSSLGDNEFPALSHKTESSKAPVAGTSKLWASSSSSGTASFSVTSSSHPHMSTGPVSKKMVMLKLNSQDDFPGLANKLSKQQGPSSVYLQMHHKQQVVPRESDWSASTGVNPVVTRLASTRNITFMNNSPVIANHSNSEVRPNTASKGDVPKSDGGWYILKKKTSKKESDADSPVHHQKNFKADLAGNKDFPVLETKARSMDRIKKESVCPIVNSCWKTDNELSIGAKKSSDLDSLSAKQQTKGKKKKQRVNTTEENMTTRVGHSLTKNKGNGPTEPSKKKKKQPSLPLPDLSTTNSSRTYTENQENEVPVDGADNVQNSNIKRSELKIGPLSLSKESVDLMSSVTDNGFQSTVSSLDDFPGLPSTGFKRKVNAPPGFNQPQIAASVGPPPGFLPTKNVTNPPPGFGTSTSITFTNSNGQNYMFASSKPPHEYIPPDGFQVRNKKLIEQLIEILANNKDNIANFRLFSGLFRKGEITASDYYHKCSDMMRNDKFVSIFPELVNLLPDIGKQQLLLAIHHGIQKQDSSSRVEPSAQFLVCATCQQVLSAKDFRTHMNHHSLNEEFPALNDSNTCLHATWVKRN